MVGDPPGRLLRSGGNYLGRGRRKASGTVVCDGRFADSHITLLGVDQTKGNVSGCQTTRVFLKKGRPRAPEPKIR